LIADLSPGALELHHYYGHDSTLIDDLIAICGPLTVFVHDYSLVCPRLVLVGGSGRYCGEPDLAGCDACVAANGSSLGNPAGLFPTVSPAPSPSSSGSIGFPPARKQAGRTSSAETASSIVPLDPRLIGGQLAGLAVLAGAVAIAIARISLRRPRPQDGPQNKRDDD